MRVTALASLASILAICIGCSTVQTLEKFTVEQCIRACSPLVPYGFRPIWRADGVCACAVPPSAKKQLRKFRIHGTH